MSRRDLLRRSGLALGAAAGLPFLAACQDGTGTTAEVDGDLPTASFGVLRAPTGALAVVAGEKGWFGDAGVNVEFESFAEGGGPKIVQAMAGGTPDIALLNVATAVLALGQGSFDLRMVSVPDDPAPALPLLSIPDVATVPDLAGRRVSTPEGGGQFFILNSILAKHDMTLDDVDFKPLPVGDAQAAFLTGKIDAVVSSANGTVLIKQAKPETRVLFTSDDFASGGGSPDSLLIPDVIITTAQAAEEKADAVRAFVRAYHDKGIDYLTAPDSQSDAVQEIQDYMKSVGAGVDDLESTASVVDAIEWYGLDDARKLMTSDTFMTGITEQAQFWVDGGVIAEMPDIEAAVDTSFLES